MAAVELLAGVFSVKPTRNADWSSRVSPFFGDGGREEDVFSPPRFVPVAGVDDGGSGPPPPPSDVGAISLLRLRGGAGGR